MDKSVMHLDSRLKNALRVTPQDIFVFETIASIDFSNQKPNVMY